MYDQHLALSIMWLSGCAIGSVTMWQWAVARKKERMQRLMVAMMTRHFMHGDVFPPREPVMWPKWGSTLQEMINAPTAEAPSTPLAPVKPALSVVGREDAANICFETVSWEDYKKERKDD